MFQFSRFASLSGCLAFNQTGCPIRKSGYLHLFAVTPGLSQLVTSFFASRSLGIPRAPLVTLPNLNDITFLNARSLVFQLLDTRQSPDSYLLVSSSIMSMNFPPYGKWRIRESNP